MLIDFFPYFKSLEIINPQFLYLSLVNIVVGIYIYINSNRITPNTFTILRKSNVIKLYLAFIFLCTISYFVAKNISLVFTKITEIIIVFCLFINFFILLKNKLNLIYNIAFIVAISAFFQSWQQLAQFIIIPKGASIINLLSNMKGNTGNINILAASLTIKIPFILLATYHFKNYKRLFLIIALFSAASVIFLTGARTPLISIFLILVVCISFLLRDSFIKRKFFIRLSYFVVPIVLAAFFSNSIFNKSKDKSRYVSLENRVSRINTEDESSKARLVYWSNILEMSKKTPFLGIGLGNYQVESIPYERTTSNDFTVSLHAHNDFLEILAETGIINGLIYFSIFIFLTFINLKKIIKAKNKETELIALLSFLLLIVYGIDSFFNFPMYRPTMAIFFAFLTALCLLNDSNYKEEIEITRLRVKITTLVLIGISIITSVSAYIIYKASNLEYLIAKDDINMNKKGMLTGDEVIKRMPSYPNTFNSSESFYEYAGVYYVREKQYDKALKCFSKASKINGYSGRIEFYKHVISKNKQNPDSAYIYIKQAFYIRPRNYDIFNASIKAAILEKDTLEIIKQHKLFSKYRTLPEAYSLAARGLEYSGYNSGSLVNFINEGLKKFPNDSVLLKQKNNLLVDNYLETGHVYENKSEKEILQKRKNDLLIADLITEGQKFEDEKKMSQALLSYEKALKIDSKSIYASQNIGFYYLKTNQAKKALNHLLNALKYPGLNDGKTEYFLAICYLQENDKNNACKYLNESKNKNYSDAKLLTDKTCIK